MKSSNILWDKLKTIEREIYALKTAHFKTATTITTTDVDSTVTLPLKLFGTPGLYYEVISSKRAIVTLESTDGSNMLSALYLKAVTPSNVNNRRIFVKREAGDVGKAKFAIYIYSQNSDDYDTLAGGGAVDLTYAIQGVCSSKFTINVTYEDFDPWT